MLIPGFHREYGWTVLLHVLVFCDHRYVYVATWSTVDYTSVTSIMHCRHVVKVVTFLFHDCDELRVRSVAAKRISVWKMLSTCSEYELLFELVMLAATVVVHCTFIKRHENVICS